MPVIFGADLVNSLKSVPELNLIYSSCHLRMLCGFVWILLVKTSTFRGKAALNPKFLKRVLIDIITC
jgi:hypothetical protein